MVAIKTSSSSSKKKTDLDKTMQALVTSVNALKDQMNSTNKDEEKRLKELKAQHDKNVKELKESFKNIIPAETRSKSIATAIGGALGWSPAVVKAMNLDKLGVALAKTTVSGIKKQLSGLFRGSDKDPAKNTSAIEANKQVPITKRLDNIISLLKTDKKSGKVVEDETKKQTGILSIIGGLLNSGLLRVVAGMAALLGLTRIVSWIAKRLGWKPNNSLTMANDAARAGHVIANTMRAARAGKDILLDKTAAAADKKLAQLDIADNVATSLNKWNDTAKELKLNAAEQAESLVSEEGVRRVAQRKNLTPSQTSALSTAAREQRAGLQAVNNAVDKQLFKDAVSAWNKVKNVAKDQKNTIKLTAGEKKAMQWVRKNAVALKAPKKFFASNVLAMILFDTTINAAIYGLLWWIEDDPVEASLLIDEALATTIIDTTGGVIGSAIGTVFAPEAGGTAWGYALGSTGADMTVAGPYNAWHAYNVRKDNGRAIPEPEEAGIMTTLFGGLGHGTEWALYGWDQGREGKENPYVKMTKESHKKIAEMVGLQDKPLEEWSTWDTIKFATADAFQKALNPVYRQNQLAASLANTGYYLGKNKTERESALTTAIDALNTENPYVDSELHEINENTKETVSQLHELINTLKKDVEKDERELKEFRRKYNLSSSSAPENPLANNNVPEMTDFEMIYGRGRV